MVLVTNALMPLFSDDNSKRFMVENFGQYLDVDPSEGASSLSMARQALGQPLIVLKELISPPGQTLLYLLGHGLPFLMVPLISLDAWILAGPSLLGLFLAQGSNDPLSITIRYTCSWSRASAWEPCSGGAVASNRSPAAARAWPGELPSAFLSCSP